MRLDSRLKLEAKRRGAAAAAKEASIIIAARVRRQPDCVVRLRLLGDTLVIATVPALHSSAASLTGGGGYGALETHVAPLIARVKGIRRRLAATHKAPGGDAHGQPAVAAAPLHRRLASFDPHLLREKLDALREMQTALREVNELGLATFRPLSQLVLERVSAVRGRGLHVLVDNPLGLTELSLLQDQQAAQRVAYDKLHGLVERARRIGRGETESDGDAMEKRIVPVPDKGCLRAANWQVGERRRLAAIRANGVLKTEASAKEALDQKARHARTEAREALEATRRTLRRFSATNSRAHGLTPTRTTPARTSAAGRAPPPAPTPPAPTPPPPPSCETRSSSPAPPPTDGRPEGEDKTTFGAPTSVAIEGPSSPCSATAHGSLGDGHTSSTEVPAGCMPAGSMPATHMPGGSMPLERLPPESPLSRASLIRFAQETPPKPTMRLRRLSERFPEMSAGNDEALAPAIAPAVARGNGSRVCAAARAQRAMALAGDDSSRLCARPSTANDSAEGGERPLGRRREAAAGKHAEATVGTGMPSDTVGDGGRSKAGDHSPVQSPSQHTRAPDPPTRPVSFGDGAALV